MSGDFIKQYWENNAKVHGSSYLASWGDNWAIELEIENISKYVHPGSNILDVGCANGFASIRQLEHNPECITGIDYSGEMIKAAKASIESLNLSNISFKEADVLNLPFEDNCFDLVYTTRVVINLPNWEEQLKAINECLRVTKINGITLFSEAFYEPLCLLNSIRAISQLTPLVEHDFNRYIKKVKLERFLNDMGYSYVNTDFSSIYYLGSRFIRELATKIEDYPGYSNPINKIFYDIEKQFSGGGFGIQQSYAIQKK
jgi:ubiquinone/menaquinone biosynthesis C-methylase UbiE